MLKLTAHFLSTKPAMQSILAGRYPILLIDESHLPFDVSCDLTPDLRIARVSTISGVTADVPIRQPKTDACEPAAVDDPLAEVDHDARIAATIAAARD